MRRFDLVCLGSGPAGERAAIVAARAGGRVAIVEREAAPGGAMVNTGTVASKVLRETALLCSSFRRRPMPGVELRLDREISFPRFLARTTVVQLEEHDRIERDVDDAAVTVIRGHGRLDGEHRVTITAPDGSTETVEAAHVLVATGSRPNRPDFIDFDHPAIVDADGILRLERMPRSLVIVGGGVIGSEYASIFAEMGVDVTVIDPRHGILRFLGNEVADRLEKRMRDAGIEFVFGAKVAEVTGIGAMRAKVVLDDGDTFDGECVLWALGRDGNTDDIGLDTVGLEPAKRGLLEVDDELRTAVPWILAAGDVIGFPALASTSRVQGERAARRIMRMPPVDSDRAPLPIGIYTIPAVGTVGPTEDELREKGHDVVTGFAEYRNNPRGRMLGDDTGLVKLVFDSNTRALLHAAVIGEDATEMVHVAQACIAAGLGIDYLRGCCFNYPSVATLYVDAAEDADRKLLTSTWRLTA